MIFWGCEVVILLMKNEHGKMGPIHLEPYIHTYVGNWFQIFQRDGKWNLWKKGQGLAKHFHKILNAQLILAYVLKPGTSYSFPNPIQTHQNDCVFQQGRRCIDHANLHHCKTYASCDVGFGYGFGNGYCCTRFGCNAWLSILLPRDAQANETQQLCV